MSGSDPAPLPDTQTERDYYMQQNLQHNHSMTFRVTEEERELIRRRQEQTGMKKTRAYLLKMAIDGRVIHVELDSVKDMKRLLSNATNNINQIARKVNETVFTSTKSKIFNRDRRKSGCSKKRFTDV